MESNDHAMEVMEHCVEAYLGHIGAMESELHDLEWHIDALRAKITGLSRPMGGIHGSGTADKVGEGLGAIEELQKEWRVKASAYAGEVVEAMELCPPSHIGKHALWLHHVEGLPWHAVGAKLGYGRSQVRRIAKGGAADLYAGMPERWRRRAIPDSDGGPHVAAVQSDGGVLVLDY